MTVEREVALTLPRLGARWQWRARWWWDFGCPMTDDSWVEMTPAVVTLGDRCQLNRRGVDSGGVGRAEWSSTASRCWWILGAVARRVAWRPSEIILFCCTKRLRVGNYGETPEISSRYANIEIYKWERRWWHCMRQQKIWVKEEGQTGRGDVEGSVFLSRILDRDWWMMFTWGKTTR